MTTDSLMQERDAKLSGWLNPVARGSRILRVAEAIGFEVVAEMVEEQDILTRLKALGVSHAQGFGSHEPQPITRFAAS